MAARIKIPKETVPEKTPRGNRRAPSRAARPKVAVDTVLFGLESGRLRCYLVQLKRGPLRGKWAFPGGLVRVGELLDHAARRELYASAGVRRA
ncbi:MAG: NUDIX domain-containing protein, partial [Candidatus Binataceae bacterium]